jgi:CHAT domain-containing protein
VRQPYRLTYLRALIVLAIGVCLSPLCALAQEQSFAIPMEAAMRSACEVKNYSAAAAVFNPDSEPFVTSAKKPDRIRLSRIATYCAQLALNDDQTDLAFELNSKAIVSIERDNDIDAGTLAQALDLQGQLLRLRKDIPRALSTHERSVAIFNASFPKELGRLAATYNYGLALLEAMQPGKAITQFESALTLAAALGKPANGFIFNLWQSKLNASLLIDPKAPSKEALEKFIHLGTSADLPLAVRARNHFFVAHTFLKAEDSANAVVHFEQAQKLNQSTALVDLAMANNINIALTSIAYTLGKSDAQREGVEASLALARKTPDNQFQIAAHLQQLSDLQWQKGNLEQAALNASQALAEITSLAPPSNVEDRTKLNELSSKANVRLTMALIKQNRLKAAETQLQKWFDPTSSSVDSLPRSVQIEAAEAVALIYMELGRFQGAESFAKKVLDLRRAEEQTDPSAIALATMNYAVVVQALGDYNRAAKLYQDALAGFNASGNLGSADRSLCLANLAGVMVRLSQPTQALDLYQQAIALEKNRQSGASRFLKGIYGNYTTLLKNLGRSKEALEINQLLLSAKSTDDTEASASDNNPSEEVRQRLALAIEELNDYRWSEAKAKLNETLTYAELRLGLQHPLVADIFTYLGWVALQLRDYKLAEEQFTKGLTARQSALGANHPEVVSSYYNLGVVFDEQKQTKKAITNFTEGLIRLRNQNQPQLAWLLEYGLSRAFGRLNDVNSALFWGWKALFSIQSMRKSVESLGVETRSTFVVDKLDVFNWVAELTIQTGRIEEAQGVMYLLKQEEFTDSDTAQAVPDFANFASTPMRRLIDRYSAAQSASITEFQQFITNTAELSKGLADASLGGSKLTSEDQLRSILRRWGNQSAFVQYLVFKNESWAVVTTTEGKFSQRLSFGSTNLQTLVASFRNQLQDTSIDPRAMGKDLYWMLIGPIERALAQAKVKRLLISLDDSLRYLPMAALHDGNRYLIEKYSITLYTEASRAKLDQEPSKNWTMAGFGVTKEHPGAVALPAVKDEFAGIVDAGVMKGSYALDEKFNLTSFQTALSSPANVLHIASHFKFDEKKADNSFLLLGDGTHLSLKMMKDLGLKFANVDLLTLSACETGLGGGRNSKGKEVEGFGILGQKLGAKGVLATLWEVADESTAITMQSVYRSRRDSELSVSDALRNAQLDLINGTQRDPSRDKMALPTRRFSGEADTDTKTPTRYLEDKRKPFAHPFYWAPFILMGNPL